MITISQNEATGDVNFAVVSGLESIRQRVHQRLLFQRGEYYLDTTKGTPYVPDILRYEYDPGLARSVITAAIRSVEGVVGVSDVVVSFNPTARTLSYAALIQTRISSFGIEGTLGG